MTIRWSSAARAELRALRKFIARDSPYYADRTTARIIERVERAARYPEAGHPVHEYPEKPLREVHEIPYRILYSVEGTTLYVVNLVHFKQRLPRRS